MIVHAACIGVLTAAVLSANDGAGAVAAESPLAVKAATVYIGDGRAISHGTILIRDGRIRRAGADVRVPDGVELIEVAGGQVTPGLIDANARVETIDVIAAARGPSMAEAGLDAGPALMVGEDEDLPPLVSGVRSTAVITEQGAEVVPHTRVLDALNLRSSDFARLARGGVTTVYVSPDASAVIGPRGAVVHTAGPLADRVLVPQAAVKTTIGSDPSLLGSYNRRPYRTSPTLYARRPNSRMGLVWVFRKAFYDAQRQRDHRRVYGADTAEPAALAVLLEVLKGDVPLRIQARIQQDILAALRLADEFELSFTLEEATEAYRCIAELKAAGVPVIFGPIYERPGGIRARSSEANRSRYYTLRALLEAGIPTALSAQELREEDGLARQAMYAQRFGVSFDDALRAVTHTPARLVGLDDQLGTIEPGKRADLVIWNGKPLAATSTPLVVIVDGKVVVDRR